MTDVVLVHEAAQEIIKGAEWMFLSARRVNGSGCAIRILVPSSKGDPLECICAETNRKVAELEKDPDCTLTFYEESVTKACSDPNKPNTVLSVHCKATIEGSDLLGDGLVAFRFIPYEVELISAPRNIWQPFCMSKTSTGKWVRVPLVFPTMNNKPELPDELGHGKQPPKVDKPNLPEKKGNQNEYTPEELRQVAINIMVKARFGLFVTTSPGGSINTRVMDTIAGPYDGKKMTFYLATYKDSRKVLDLKKNSSATLCWFEKDENKRCTSKPSGCARIVGDCELIDDHQEKTKYYSADWDPFMEKGAETESYILIKVVAKEIELCSTEWNVGCLKDLYCDPCCLKKGQGDEWQFV